jgi:hypothetical protein
MMMQRAATIALLLAAIAFPLAMQALDQAYYISFASRIMIYALAAVKALGGGVFYIAQSKWNVRQPATQQNSGNILPLISQQDYIWSSNFTDANLTNANLTGATFTNANFTGANLTGANLTNANLYGARLTYANLTNANLTDATLSGVDLYGATLTGAINVPNETPGG